MGNSLCGVHAIDNALHATGSPAQSPHVCRCCAIVDSIDTQNQCNMLSVCMIATSST